MTAVYFFYGLAFFSLGLAVALEVRRASGLALSRHLPWLAVFGLVHSLVEWSDMLLLSAPDSLLQSGLMVFRSIALPLSALALVRFGVGLISEAGPLPEWLTFIPVVLLVPAALIVGYALIISITEPPVETATDVWSRYLLYFPGCLLAAFGFVRQGRRLPLVGLGHVRSMLWGAALAFGFNAFVAGLIVPSAPYGLAPWLNYDSVLTYTGIPVQVWRACAALGVMWLVIRALGVFEAERRQELAGLETARVRAQQASLRTESRARQVAEDWTNALANIGRRIAHMESVDEALRVIVDLARQLLSADTAALALWDETGLRLELKCYAIPQETKSNGSTAISNTLILDAVRALHSRRFPDDTGQPEGRWICPMLHQEVKSAVIVPLQLDQRSLGGLWITRLSPIAFTPDEVLELERLADQAVIALEHALMAARLQSLAILEERSRIAREMHDGLAQVLGYLSLETQTLEALVRQGECEAALAELKGARVRILEAQADVRENILSLRTTLSGQAGLIPALQEYVGEFEVQTGIKTTIWSDLANELRLSPLAEAQLIRIVQEALTNVRKHARAAHARLQLTAPDGCLRVTVADDGCGFEASAVGRGHFGLHTMRERAESVGGGCAILSTPGAGTHIELWLPVVQA